MKTQNLNTAVQRLLLNATQGRGIDDALMFIEESLTGDEYDAVEAFLEWLKKTDRSFGWNIATVVREWKNSLR